MHYVLNYRKAIIIKNIKYINNEATSVEINLLKKQYYNYLASLILETIWCYTASKEEIISKIKVKNIELFDELAHNNQNATILLSHIGNWELLCQGTTLFLPKFNIITLYTPIKNKYVNQLLLKYRSRFGVEMISTKSTLELYRKQKMEGVSINFFAIDQNPGDPFHQYWTDLFNVKVPVISGAEKFAISQKQPVYYLNVQKENGIYELEFEKIDYNAAIPFDITEKQMKLVEKNIKQKPFLWLLSHNRFKYLKNDLENETNH